MKNFSLETNALVLLLAHTYYSSSNLYIFYTHSTTSPFRKMVMKEFLFSYGVYGFCSSFNDYFPIICFVQVFWKILLTSEKQNWKKNERRSVLNRKKILIRRICGLKLWLILYNFMCSYSPYEFNFPC